MTLIALLWGMNAEAASLGSSIGFGGGGGGATASGFLPSFDLIADPVTVNFHVLELFDAVTAGDLFLGANVYFDAVSRPVDPGVLVLQPGFGVDLFADPTVVWATGEARIGFQSKGDTGFGCWVVPALGFVSGQGTTDLVATGTLQLGAFFGLGG